MGHLSSEKEINLEQMKSNAVNSKCWVHVSYILKLVVPRWVEMKFVPPSPVPLNHKHDVPCNVHTVSGLWALQSRLKQFSWNFSLLFCPRSSFPVHYCSNSWISPLIASPTYFLNLMTGCSSPDLTLLLSLGDRISVCFRKSSHWTPLQLLALY